MERTETIQRPELQTQTSVPSKAPRRRTRFGWLWLILIAALGYGGYRYMEASQQEQKDAAAKAAARNAPRAVPVAAAPARAGDIPIYVRGLGSVAPFYNVVVKSRVDGQLMRVYFNEGQFVKAGQLLAEIDPRPFLVQLQQAEGQMARDKAQLNDAKVNLQRYETLWKQQIIPQQQRDTAAAQVGQFEGTLAADQAAIDNAKLQLTYSKITAPISGRIGLRQVDPGNMVHASDPNGLVSIAQMQPIAVLFTVPSDNLPPILQKLRSGVKLRVDAYDSNDVNRIATGTVETVDNQIDPTTGTARIKAVFPNTDGALFPSQFVNCRLLLNVEHGVVIVPAPAIQRGPQGTFVYAIAPGGDTAQVRQVTIGATEGNEVTVSEGLTSGDMVVVDGQDKLQNGSKVAVRTANRAAGNANAPGGRGYANPNGPGLGQGVRPAGPPVVGPGVSQNPNAPGVGPGPGNPNWPHRGGGPLDMSRHGAAPAAGPGGNPRR